jgi:hypothetical protein
MASEVKPGQWVNVTIKSRPRAEARVKTMNRLLSQDPQIKKERERQSKARPTREHRRGGRMWRDNPPHLNPVEVRPGVTYKIFASVDVLRDLKSIASNVEVAPA